MLPRLIGSLVWFPALVGLGSLLLLFIRRIIDVPRDIANLMFMLLAGIACLGTIANAANYFVPTGTLLPDIALVAGWLLLIVNLRQIIPLIIPTNRSAILKFALLFAVVLVVSAYYAQRGFLNIDVPNYHFPAVKWTTDSILPLGLANVNPWFGYNYLWFQAAAMLEAIPTGNYSAFFLNTILLAGFAMIVWNRIFDGLRDGLTPSQIFLYLCVGAWGMFIFFSPKEIFSFTPNFATAVLAVVSVYITLRATEQADHWLYYLVMAALLAVLGVTIKISSATLLVAPVMVVIYYWRQVRSQLAAYARKTLLIVIPVSLLIVVPWLPRGIITSGCVVFPIASTCVRSLPWALTPETVSAEYTDVQTVNRMMNSFSVPSSEQQQWQETFGWVPYWVKWMTTQEARTEPLLAMLILGLVLWIVNVAIDRHRLLDHQLPFLLSAIAPLAAMAVWFFTVPGMNFIYGSLAAISLLILSSAVYRLILILPRVTAGLQSVLPRLGTVAVAILILVIVGKIGKDAVTHQRYILLDWPRMPAAEITVATTTSGVKYYVPTNFQTCSDAPIPCALNANLSISTDGRGNISEVIASPGQQSNAPSLDP